MSDHNDEGKLLEGHSYDGIQEYDNPMPKWWINLFVATVVFGVLYFIHYELGNGPGIDQEYQAELDAFDTAQRSTALASTDGATEVTPEILNSLLDDSSALSSGQQIYVNNCQACHGSQGEGQIGPNLTDMYWIHGGGKLQGIYTVVSQGVLEKGMPAWDRQLSPEELNHVVAYVGSMRGKKLPGKEPQGDRIEAGDATAKGTER